MRGAVGLDNGADEGGEAQRERGAGALVEVDAAVIVENGGKANAFNGRTAFTRS